MKDVTDIFLINEEGLLEINKIEARSVPEFKAILIRDKGGKVEGDYDGRRKFFAFKELMYVFLYSHPSSIYRDLSDESRRYKCIEHAELPNDWKPDEIIKDAGKALLKLLDMSALYHSYLNANRGVYSLGEDLKFFNTMRDKMRKSVLDKMKELEKAVMEEDKQRLEAEVDHITTRLIDMGIKISSISNNLPTAFETVEKLKVKLLNDVQSGGKIYGGGVLNNREA